MNVQFCNAHSRHHQQLIFLVPLHKWQYGKIRELELAWTPMLSTPAISNIRSYPEVWYVKQTASAAIYGVCEHVSPCMKDCVWRSICMWVYVWRSVCACMKQYVWTWVRVCWEWAHKILRIIVWKFQILDHPLIFLKEEPSSRKLNGLFKDTSLRRGRVTLELDFMFLSTLLFFSPAKCIIHSFTSHCHAYFNK